MDRHSAYPTHNDPRLMGLRVTQPEPAALLPLDLEHERAVVQLACQDSFQVIDATLEGEGVSRLRLSNILFRQASSPQRASLFHFYPYLFAERFPSVSLARLRRLTVAAQLFFAHHLIQDRFLDDDPVCPLLEKSYYSLAGTLLHEQSLLILAELFASTSSFWAQFVAYRQRWLIATWTEKQWVARWPRRPPLTTVLEVARDKTAMARFLPVALAILADESTTSPALDESQSLAATAFQLYDDLLDWREDYRRRHLTWPICRALENAGISSDPCQEEMPAVDVLGHHLYFSGAAEETLERAHVFYQAALDQAADLPIPRWRQHLLSLQKANWRLKTDLNELKEKHLLTGRRQALADLPPRPRHVPHERRLERAIADATRFLLVSQTPDGHWRDLQLESGSSTEYVTACVGQALLSTPEPPTNAIARARAWLLHAQHADGGWGWHAGFASDTDSTANALLFLRSGGDVAAVERGLGFLLENAVATGGVRTYHPRDVGEHCVGWCSPTTTITALTVQLLRALRHDPGHPPLSLLIHYLRAQQKASGSWDAYWWRGEMISTGHCLLALDGTTGSDEAVVRATRWLSASQNADGGWGYTANAPDSLPINTAMGLCALSRIAVPSRSQRSAANWLLEAQAADGGWAAYPILRFPQPDVLAPWDDPAFPEMEPASRRDDNNRLLTTATALRALVAHRNNMQASS